LSLRRSIDIKPRRLPGVAGDDVDVVSRLDAPRDVVAHGQGDTNVSIRDSERWTGSHAVLPKRGEHSTENRNTLKDDLCRRDLPNAARDIRRLTAGRFDESGELSKARVGAERNITGSHLLD